MIIQAREVSPAAEVFSACKIQVERKVDGPYLPGRSQHLTATDSIPAHALLACLGLKVTAKLVL